MGGDQDNKHEQKLQAVLLADSFVCTFQPITLDKNTPKVLCPLNNITLLDYAIEFLAGAGVEELYVFCVTGGDAVENYLAQSVNPWTSKIKTNCIKDSSVTNAGDALRELDKRNLIGGGTDPFILMSGDVVTNVDIVPALQQHKARQKKDSSAIMTVLMKQVGGWSADGEKGTTYKASGLRSMNDDLVVALNSATGGSGSSGGNYNNQEGGDSQDQQTSDKIQPRILLYDSNPSKTTMTLPTSFFNSNAQIELRNDMLDTGIYICSPDVLARFSDEFDFLSISKFISNSVAEEEEGLQSKIYACILSNHEYAARIHDPRTYHTVSRDLLRRWCYPIVPDNLPSGYDKIYRYEMQRHMMYVEQKDKGKIGRSAIVKGPGMVGSQTIVESKCIIKQTVIGNNCHIGPNVTIADSHLWSNVTIEENTSITESILCNDCIIKRGAVIPKGCIIGKGCVIGENVKLPEFTRVTLCMEQEEDDDFDDFDDDDSGFSSSSSSSNSGSDSSASDEESEEEMKETKMTTDTNACTDQNVVGKDGIGRVWKPSFENFGALEGDGDDSDYDSDDEEAALKRTMDVVQAQSIGFDPSVTFEKRMQRQLEDDFLNEDEFCAEDMGEEDAYGFGSGSYDDGDNHHPPSSNLDEDGFLITGRQAGVDVVKEMKSICLDHDTSSPIENLRIELSSFKFSQNASFGDCVTGAMFAIFERLKLTPDTSLAKLVASFKAELKHWGELLEKLCRTVDEEKSVIVAVETVATGRGVIGDILGKEPAFRFILQTLHSEEIVSDEAIFSWAVLRKDGNPESPQGKLFQQAPTQEFLEWIEEDSDSSGSGSSSSDSDDD